MNGCSLFIFLFCIIFICSSAQEIERKNYDQKGRPISDESGCYYYSLVKNGKFRRPLDTLYTFYCKTNSLRSKEVIHKNGLRHGWYIQYNETGEKVLTGTFEDGMPKVIQQWYPNGNLKSKERYKEDIFYLDEYYDDAGRPVVEKGKGRFKGSLSEFYNGAHEIIAVVTNGLPDSVWLGFNKDKTLYYREEYQKGKLLGGISYDSSGKTYAYTRIEKPAEFPGGFAAFYRNVSNELVYPVTARRYGIEGKVFVEFTVLPDGSLANVKVVKGIGGGCDEEAERVIKLSKKWIPAELRGQKVESRFVVPISFKLG